MRDLGTGHGEAKHDVEVRRVTSLADRAAVIRMRVDIGNRTRDVYGGSASAAPPAVVTPGTFGAFVLDRAIAAVDTHWTSDRPLPRELADSLGIPAAELARRPLGVLERVHVHPDHRNRHPVELLLQEVCDEARRRGVSRLYGISDLVSLPSFRAGGFRPQGPLVGSDDNELFVTVADVEGVATRAAAAASSEAHVAPPTAARTGPSRGIFSEGLLARLEPALGTRGYFRVLGGARLPRSGRTGTLVILVVSGTVEVADDGRHVASVRAGEAMVEAEAVAGRTWTGGAGGATAIVLGADELRDLVVRYPELGGEVVVALLRGVAE